MYYTTVSCDTCKTNTASYTHDLIKTMGWYDYYGSCYHGAIGGYCPLKSPNERCSDNM